MGQTGSVKAQRLLFFFILGHSSHKVEVKETYTIKRPKMSSDNTSDKTLKWAIEEKRTAVFSPCRKWRYHLQHVWDDNQPNLLWLMLNPSTADETQNDPTVERCEQRARMWGYGGVEIYNIFGFRATDPNNMKAYGDPVGPDNDKWITKFALKSQQTLAIAGWGNHGSHNKRNEEIIKIITQNNGRVKALKINASGDPKHPLYVGYAQKPVLFIGA